MSYYENMCTGHWLNEETRELLNGNNKKVTIVGAEFSVPNEQFFSARGAKLRHYFEKILDRDLDTKEIIV